ncbi:MAG: flavin reductase family protein [Saprospiraceae bacterium]|nr:flavin reductase family protein [Saprospiraceae bacterium]
MYFEPNNLSTKDLHQLLLGIVAPRPIAFVSTVDSEGNPNLAPFSFFNCFSSNPPIVIFSANRRVSNNTTKDTLANVIATGECVINAVSHQVVRQVTLCSVDYPSDVNEFVKSGLTPIPSDLVKPPRVKECLAHLECKVKEVMPLGEGGGAGNLIICEVVRIHADPSILDENQQIDPHKIDLMARMGRAFYSRASGDAVYKIFQPYIASPIGFENLPETFKQSHILTANDLAALASLESLPTDDEIAEMAQEKEVKQILEQADYKTLLQHYAHRMLTMERKKEAFMAMLLSIGQ